MQYNSEIVDQYSETGSQSERAAAIKWLSAQGEAIQIEAFKFQTDLLRQRREKGIRVTPELAYSLLVLVCRKMRFEEDSLRIKQRMTANEAAKIQERRLERMKVFRRGKPSVKKEIIRVKYFHLVQQLRAEGLGWRNCSAYLAKFHNFHVTFSYLKTTILEIERLQNGNQISP